MFNLSQHISTFHMDVLTLHHKRLKFVLESKVSHIQEGKRVVTSLTPFWQQDKSVDSDSKNQCLMIAKLPQLTDYGIYNVSCSAAHNVALFCAYRNVTTVASIHSSLSGITVKQVIPNITQLTLDHACPIDWFPVHGSCLRLQRCYLSCVRVCPKSTPTALFLDMLLQELCISKNNEQGDIDKYLKVLSSFPLDAIDINRQDAVFTSLKSLLIHFPKQSVCNGVIMQAFVMLHDLQVVDDNSTHSLIMHSKPVITNSALPDFNQFVLCESSPRQCKDRYFQCSDGTCLDDALLCDGTMHCIDGEDEADCQHVCTHQNNCFSSCSFEDDCRCHHSFFQCVRGGCIPLARVCDGYSQCSDSSDEPPTCLYGEQIMIPKVLEPTVYHAANQYISNRVDVLNKVRESCLSGVLEKAKMKHVNLEMNVLTPICPIVSNTLRREELSRLHGICQFINITHAEVYLLRYQCMYDYNADCRPGFYEHCSNGFHLQHCEDYECRGRYKCTASYCIPLKNVCNRDCNCPLCDEESFCKKLTCPGLVVTMKHNVLHCSASGDHVTTTVGRRKEYSAPSKYPVYISKYIHTHSVDEYSFNIRHPEIITHFSITDLSIGSSIFPLIGKLVSIRVLDMSHDNIHKLNEHSFVGLTELEMLDLSHNSIMYIPKSFWCSRDKLRYLYLNNNNLKQLDFQLLFGVKELRVVALQENEIVSSPVQSVPVTNNLLIVQSDLAKLCCMLPAKLSCSPQFTMVISCTSLINSSLQVYTVWLIGSAATICNCITLVLVIIGLIKSTRREITPVMSFTCNLSVADTMTSVCLFTIPIVNWYYEGSFGLYADIWAQSLFCHALEFIVFVSVESSLITTGMISVFAAIVIPSMTKAKSYRKAKRLAVGLCWSSSTVVGLGRQAAVFIQEFHNDNYLCLPFFNKSSGYISKIFHFLITICNLLFVVIVIISYTYFLQYLSLNYHNNSKHHSQRKKTQIKLLRMRMHMLLLSNNVTWLPLLVLQSVGLLGYTWEQSIILWVVLFSLPLNLILDPFLVVLPTIKNLLFS